MRSRARAAMKSAMLGVGLARVKYHARPTAKKRSAWRMVFSRLVQERRDRLDDALNATRAAVEEGIVAGGGVLKAIKAINVTGDNEAQDARISLVHKALQSPIRQIAENSGVEGSIVVGRVLEERLGEYGDMIERGIIDPAKVVCVALQDAASIAGLMITTEVGVAEAPHQCGPRRPRRWRRNGRHDVGADQPPT
jgi:chaperonin GroEL (HSP60 family)